jgi:hypothetical protein
MTLMRYLTPTLDEMYENEDPILVTSLANLQQFHGVPTMGGRDLHSET